MRVLEKLFDVVTPYDCLVCGHEGKLICPWCWPDAFDSVPSRCFICKKASSDSTSCKNCITSSVTLEHVWVATAYTGYSKQLVKGMKFAQHRQAAHLIAAQLHQTLPYLDGDYIVTYVPTASSRRRERGFDHAKLIAAEFARVRRLAYAPLLIRCNQTRQVGHSRSERLAQVAGAYRPARSRHISKRKILLIDDVITTGATIQEASRVLRAAGAKSVDAAIFAQAA